MVQVNGKVRGEFESVAGASDAELEAKARQLPEIMKWTDGKEVKKVIVVKGKLVNILV